MKTLRSIWIANDSDDHLGVLIEAEIIKSVLTGTCVTAFRSLSFRIARRHPGDDFVCSWRRRVRLTWQLQGCEGEQSGDEDAESHGQNWNTNFPRYSLQAGL
ncbi:MAG: hypothetical protein ACLP00_15165, partial [Terracidiphilus sp.]